MRRYIDVASILTEARMMWSDYKEPYVLVEGISDKLFLSTFIEDERKIVYRVVDGWENVNSAILQAKDSKFTQIVGIIDRDYHEIVGDGVVPSDQLLFTDAKDIEMMLFLSGAFDKFLRVCGSCDKVEAIQNPRAIIEAAAFPVGALRILSLSKGYCFCFDGLSLRDFVDKNNLSVDIDKMISVVVQRTISKGSRVTVAEKEIKDDVLKIISSENQANCCNGHDVFDLICLAMTKLFATSSSKAFSSEDIFQYLLVGYPKEDFFQTSLYNSLDTYLNRIIG